MADYKIYIHSYAEGGGTTAPTKPWDNQPSNGETSPFEVAENAIQKTQQFATSGFSSAANTGVATLSRAFPAVALAVVAAKVAESILTTGFQHVETYTGHYEYSMGFNNFKTAVSNAFNPMGVWFKNMHREYQFNLQNKRIEQERTLVGNSILSISVKGV